MFATRLRMFYAMNRTATPSASPMAVILHTSRHTDGSMQLQPRHRDRARIHPAGEVSPGRDGTIEWAVVPGQNLMSHPPFAQYKPQHQESGLAVDEARPVGDGSERVPGLPCPSVLR